MKKTNDLNFLVQVLLSVVAIIFYIISIFEKTFFNVAELFLALTLFTMAYNNHKIYKRKYFTIAYLIFGFLLLIGAITGIIYGK